MTRTNEALSLEQLLNTKKQFIKIKEISLDDLTSSFPSLLASLKDANGVGDYRVVCCDTLGIWFLRAVQLLSKDTSVTSVLQALVTDTEATFIFKYVIDFWNESGAPLGNSLREMFVKLISFLTTLADQTNLFTEWLKEVLETCPFTMRALYFMVEHLTAQVKGASIYILKEYSNFIKTAISYMWSNALAHPVGKALRAIFANYLEVTDSEDWLRSWDYLIIEYMRHDNLRKSIQNYILPYLFQMSPECYRIFVKELVDANDPENMSLMLISLRIGYEQSIVEEPFEGEDKLISIEVLSELISSNNTFYQLEAFSLLAVSPRGSRPISNQVLNLVYSKLHIFFSEMSLETRNEFLSMFKKFILRLRDSIYAINRTAVKLQAKNKFPEEVKQNLTKVEEARQFLSKLISFLVENMRPGVSFQRCNMSLKVLIALLRSGIDTSVDSKHFEKLHMDYPFNFEIFKNPKVLRLLIDNITDEFEEVRELCIVALSMSSLPVKELITETEFSLILTRSFIMLGDLKGRKADAGSRVLQFFFSNGHQKTQIMEKILANLLRDIELAKTNMVAAVYKANVHGYFLALNTILTRVTAKAELELFVDHFGVILKAIFDIWEMTKPVLTHDSPEGNLPEHLQQALEPSLKHFETKFGPPTQVILSYSWRAVKESTALVATMLTKLNEDRVFENCPIALNDVGLMIIDQLSTIRHPGAFSSVYPTFISCCDRCFRLDHAELPKLWLDKNISFLQNESHSITRRSGGLPFLITAVLTSEYNSVRKAQTKGKREVPPLFAQTFDQLYEIASLPFDESTGEETLDLPQVHALNSIKSLFIESQLSDLSNFYVDKSLEIALARFATAHWSMRNASVMLFTALQNRLFGTKKIDNNHLSTVSARLFFSRYRNLQSVLLTNFESALNNYKEVENLFPILTIISRLHTTAGYKPLLCFKSLLLASLQNKYWKVREMAARALPSIVEEDFFHEQILELLNTIDFKNNNQVQGYLFAVKELLIRINLRKGYKENHSVPPNICDALYSLCDDALSSHRSAAIAYIQTLDLVFDRVSSTDDIPISVVNKLGRFYLKENELKTLDGAKQLLVSRISALLFKYYFKTFDLESLMTLLKLGLYSPLYECQLASISFASEHIELLAGEEKDQIVEILWMLLDSDAWNYVKAKGLSLLREILVANQQEDGVDVRGKINILFELMKDPSEDIKAAALECCGPFISRLEDNVVFSKWLELISSFSEDDVPYLLRFSALKSCKSFLQVSDFKSGPGCVTVMVKLREFLLDDDDEIRETASDFISKFLLHSNLSMISVEAEARYATYLSSNYDQNLLSQSIGKRYVEKLASLKLVLVDESLLFEVEKDNFYKNTIDEFKFFMEWLPHVPVEIMEQIDNIVIQQIDEVRGLVSLEDDILGAFRIEEYFNFLYLILFHVKTLQIETDLTEILKQKQDLHPMLKELLY